MGRRRIFATVVMVGTIGLGTGALVPGPASAEASATTVAGATPAKLKLAKCTAPNRTVNLTSKATKTYRGKAYGVEATRQIKMCTTKKNVTTVYSSTLWIKAISGGSAKVTVSAGSTTKSISKGVTTVKTPVACKAKAFLVATHHANGIHTTTVTGKGIVRSWIGHITGS